MFAQILGIVLAPQQPQVVDETEAGANPAGLLARRLWSTLYRSTSDSA